MPDKIPDWAKDLTPVKTPAPAKVEAPSGPADNAPIPNALPVSEEWQPIYERLKANESTLGKYLNIPQKASQKDEFFKRLAQEAYAQNGEKSYFRESMDRGGGSDLDPETFNALGGRFSPLAEIANTAYKGYRAGIAGVEAGAQGFDDVLKNTGIANLTDGLLGIHDSLQPGKGLLALMEALPIGGAEAGMAPGFMTPKGDMVTPEVRARLNEEATVLANKKGVTRADYDAWTDKNGMPRYGPELDRYLAGLEADKAAAKAPEKPVEPTKSKANDDPEPADKTYNFADATPDSDPKIHLKNAGLGNATLYQMPKSEARALVGKLADLSAEDQTALLREVDSDGYASFKTKTGTEAVDSFLNQITPENMSRDADGKVIMPEADPIPTKDGVPPTAPQALVELTPETYADRVMNEGEKFLNSPEAVDYFAKNSEAIKNVLDERIANPTPDGPPPPEAPVEKAEAGTPDSAAASDGSVPPPEEPPVPPSGGDGGAPTGPEGPDVIARLTNALSQAKRLLPEKKAMIAKERAIRVAKGGQVSDDLTGVDRYKAQLAALKGEMPTPDFEIPGEKFTKEEVNSLYDHIDKNISGDTDFFNNIKAKSGLGKLMQGKVPGMSELDAMSKAFPPDFMKSVLMQRGKLQKLVGGALDVNGLMKSMMSTLDLSAPLRQGAPLIASKEYWKAFVQMHKDFGSEKSFLASEEAIKALPSYKIAKQNGLFLAERNGGLSSMEESFMSRFADKIPLVKNSERAYVGFLNKLRADTFQSLWDKADKADIAVDPKELANYINTMTGRGNLGYLNSAGVLLNQAFFSPRLIASRVQLLNPLTYWKASPFVRREMIANMGAYSGVVASALSLAKMGGADVSTNYHDPDFLKIKVGNTRFDVAGGFTQYVRVAARVGEELGKTGYDVATTGQSGKVKYGAKTAAGMVGDFFRNKTSPLTGMAWDLLDGKNSIGQPFEVKKELVDHFASLFAQDVADVMTDQGVNILHPSTYGNIPKAAAMALPGVYGVGVQTYDANKKSNQGTPGPYTGTTPEWDKGAAPEKTSSLSLIPTASASEKKTKIPDWAAPDWADLSTTPENTDAKKLLSDLGARITDSGIRSHEEQKELYSKYSGVAKPGTSAHEEGRGLDFAPTRGMSPDDIQEEFENAGYYGVKIITKRHGSAPHWHVEWEGRD